MDAFGELMGLVALVICIRSIVYGIAILIFDTRDPNTWYGGGRAAIHAAINGDPEDALRRLIVRVAARALSTPCLVSQIPGSRGHHLRPLNRRRVANERVVRERPSESSRPESCAGGREDAGEALTGAHAGQPLTSEITLTGVPTPYDEGNATWQMR